MRRASGVAAVVLIWAAVAAGDEVVLKNGAVFRGEVLSEDAHKVVLKTTAGAKLTLPRREVAKVERSAQSEGARLFERGRQALKRGEREEAIELFEQAAASADPSAVRAAKDELRRLRAPAADPDPGPSVPGIPAGEDPFDPPEGEAIVRELAAAAAGGNESAARRLTVRLYQRARAHQEAKRWREAAVDYERTLTSGGALYEAKYTESWRLAARQCRLRVARDAIRVRDARLALAAVEPVHGAADLEESLKPSAVYFYGRALELSNRRDQAIKIYGELLGDSRPAQREAGAYRELVRLATVGIKPGPDSPGVGASWRAQTTRRFSILYSLPAEDPELGQRFEAWYAEASERLGLKGPSVQDRIQVFLYPDRESYQRSDGARIWSEGHATRLQAAHDEAEELRVIYFYPSGADATVARHEIAHILTWDSLQGADRDLPVWAVEGAAIYAEPDATRAGRRTQATRWRTTLDPTRSALARMLFPATQDAREVGEFYVQSGVNFGLLADRVGVDRAFRAALKINTQGPEQALRSVGVDLGEFEREVEQALGGSLPREESQKQ